MKSLLKKLENPVFVKEMRVGFREKKVFYALVAWVVLVALVASLTSLGAFDKSNSIDQMAESGRTFIEILFWVQLVLLAMLAPSLTTSAVSGERERSSFDMLLTTHLSPPELIFGKFGFAASFIFLALFATVPLESIVFFLGGVSVGAFVLSKLILVAFGFLCCLYGLVMSARETRSSYATGQTYLGLILLFPFVAFGVSAVRYMPDVPWLIYLGVAVVTVYVSLFLFWKAVNHLEERARHLQVLLLIGLVFYLMCLGIAVAVQQTVPNVDDAAWAISGPIHYLLFGLMLNPMRPSRRIEQERFERSMLSRPFIWMALLTVGLMGPLLLCEDEQAMAICLYGLASGLGTAWFARSLTLKNPARYPQILGTCWLLLNVLPAFTLIEEFNRSSHTWHPATLSPLVMLISYMDRSPVDAPFLALAFYGLLFFCGIWLHRRFYKRKSVSQA